MGNGPSDANGKTVVDYYNCHNCCTGGVAHQSVDVVKAEEVPKRRPCDEPGIPVAVKEYERSGKVSNFGAAATYGTVSHGYDGRAADGGEFRYSREKALDAGCIVYAGQSNDARSMNLADPRHCGQQCDDRRFDGPVALHGCESRGGDSRPRSLSPAPEVGTPRPIGHYSDGRFSDGGAAVPQAFDPDDRSRHDAFADDRSRLIDHGQAYSGRYVRGAGPYFPPHGSLSNEGGVPDEQGVTARVSGGSSSLGHVNPFDTHQVYGDQGLDAKVVDGGASRPRDSDYVAFRRDSGSGSPPADGHTMRARQLHGPGYDERGPNSHGGEHGTPHGGAVQACGHGCDVRGPQWPGYDVRDQQVAPAHAGGQRYDVVGPRGHGCHARDLHQTSGQTYGENVGASAQADYFPPPVAAPQDRRPPSPPLPETGRPEARIPSPQEQRDEVTLASPSRSLLEQQQQLQIEQQQQVIDRLLREQQQRDRELETEREQARERERQREVEKERERTRELERELQRAREVEREREAELEREKERARLLEQGQELEREREREQHLARERQQQQELEREYQQDLERERAREMQREQDLPMPPPAASLITPEMAQEQQRKLESMAHLAVLPQVSPHLQMTDFQAASAFPVAGSQAADPSQMNATPVTAIGTMSGHRPQPQLQGALQQPMATKTAISGSSPKFEDMPQLHTMTGPFAPAAVQLRSVSMPQLQMPQPEMQVVQSQVQRQQVHTAVPSVMRVATLAGPPPVVLAPPQPSPVLTRAVQQVAAPVHIVTPQVSPRQVHTVAAPKAKRRVSFAPSPVEQLHSVPGGLASSGPQPFNPPSAPGQGSSLIAPQFDNQLEMAAQVQTMTLPSAPSGGFTIDMIANAAPIAYGGPQTDQYFGASCEDGTATLS